MNKLLVKLFMIAALVLSFAIFVPAYAAPIDPFTPCSATSDSDVCNAVGAGGGLFGPNSIWNNILNILTYVVGAIAVLMIIIGAIRYGLSGGDQGSVTAAKNTIIYALVALIIAVMANALVNFVLTNI